MEKALSTREIISEALESGVLKASQPWLKTAILAFLAGAFIAFAAEGSNMAAFNLLSDSSTFGLGKCLAGAIFGTGLMLVVLAGGELFTGNTMMLTPFLAKRIRLGKVLRNWCIVFLGNLAGSIFIAWLMVSSGLFSSGAGLLGGMTIKIATYKVGLSFWKAFALGIMCNMLVCSAIWMSLGAKDVTGKVLVIFFPIWLFITSGFEHSVANMYYIPAGILALENPEWVSKALEIGVSVPQVNSLTWQGFFGNLLPVTLGNIVGGGVLVSTLYWLAYRRPKT